MKSACRWLSIVLALLLPLQGAVAAMRLCPHQVVGSAQPLLAPVDDGMMSDAEMAEMSHPADHPHEQAGQASDKCGLCAACCSGAAMVASWLAGLSVPPALAQAFVDAAQPDASFVSAGPERPPRSS